jgi:hypothetical protein
MKNIGVGKATGPDTIARKIIEALEEFGINKVAELLNSLYDSGHLPKPLPK